jgi:hypothetical protein
VNLPSGKSRLQGLNRAVCRRHQDQERMEAEDPDEECEKERGMQMAPGTRVVVFVLCIMYWPTPCRFQPTSSTNTARR